MAEVTGAGNEATRAWFHEAKLGLFIHWGIYALLGKGEWIRTVDQIPLEEYAKLHPQWRPTSFEAGAWAELAAAAGVQYMVVTTKHHDGWCLFDAPNTTWKSTASPDGRDLIGELVTAFEAQQIPVGFYYSIMDWHHPDYLPRLSWEEPTRSAAGADPQRYVAYMREQLRHLLTAYRPAPFVIWYDGGWMNKPEELSGVETNAELRRLKPDILINDRHFTKEDLVTPEQRIPPTGLFDEQGEPLLWEACLTMTSHWWGYDAHETVYKTPQFLIRTLVDIVSKGGNLLLNIGPQADGTIQEEFVERLQAIGDWLNRYAEAIYGTTASPFNQLPFYGRVTVKGERLYVHVFEWPGDRLLRLPGLANQVHGAQLLDSGAPVGVRRDGDDWLVVLPEAAPDTAASVLAVDLDGPPQVTPWVLRPNRRGVVELPVVVGQLDGPHGMKVRYETCDGELHAGNWLNPKDSVEWTFEVPAAGEYEVWINHRVEPGQGGSTIALILNGQETLLLAPNGLAFGTGGTQASGEALRAAGQTRSTGGRFCRRRVARLTLPAGRNVLKVLLPTIRRQRGWDLRGVLLRPRRGEAVT
ncbi:MAG: alpha-L-fucosidase [Fimbriimonadaceae bacterium]|nr:alpha-L-fucosidase [Fimbriimonadaceae bacterium]